MPEADDQRGRASGYSVDEDPEGGFRWSAYGPEGVREGHAELREEAEAAAQEAEAAAQAAERELTPRPKGTA